MGLLYPSNQKQSATNQLNLLRAVLIRIFKRLLLTMDPVM